MGNGKRIKSKKKPITMERGEFKQFMLNVVSVCDDASYAGLCELMLMACGVVDMDGNITEQYAESPYWVLDDGVLKLSEHAKLAREVSRQIVRDTVEAMA